MNFNLETKSQGIVNKCFVAYILPSILQQRTTKDIVQIRESKIYSENKTRDYTTMRVFIVFM